MSHISLTQQYLQRMILVSQDYVQEHMGWSAWNNKTTKCLPYAGDQEAVFKLHAIGSYLYHACPTIRSATEKFISFVVGSGHTYDVSRTPGTPLTKTTVEDSVLDKIRWIVNHTTSHCFPGGWLAFQEETMRRYLREGEAFRRIFRTGDGIEVRFLEPGTIRQRPGHDANGEPYPGNMGIIYRGASGSVDASKPTGYWHCKNLELGDRQENYEQISTGSLQHLKYGVDANDPRGVGPYPMVMCHSQRIKTTGIAMNELALTQSSYAVVRQYDNVVTAEEMRRIARGFKEADEAKGNEREFGKEVDAKGFKFEFPSMGVDPKNFIAIINQEKDFIAGVLDMPGFMLSSKAAGGSRAASVSEEGPFGRRISREQTKQGVLDVELLWEAVKHLGEYDDDTMSDIRKAVQITPSFPVAYTRDILKDTQALSLQVEKKLISHQGAAEKLGNDWSVTSVEIEQEAKKEFLQDAAKAVDPNKPQAARNPKQANQSKPTKKKSSKASTARG